MSCYLKIATATTTNTVQVPFENDITNWLDWPTHSFIKQPNRLWFYDKFIRLADFNCHTITITITLALWASIVQSILLTSNCNQSQTQYRVCTRDIRVSVLMPMCDVNDCNQPVFSFFIHDKENYNGLNHFLSNHES